MLAPPAAADMSSPFVSPSPSSSYPTTTSSSFSSSPSSSSAAAVRQSVLEGVVTQLHTIIRPFMMRRLKSEVEALSLPQKLELLVHCPLTEVQRAFYSLILNRDWLRLAASAGAGTGKMRLLNVVMQLRKACNHPALFGSVFVAFYQRYLHALRQGRSLNDLLADLLAQEEEKRTLYILLLTWPRSCGSER